MFFCHSTLGIFYEEDAFLYIQTQDRQMKHQPTKRQVGIR